MLIFILFFNWFFGIIFLQRGWRVVMDVEPFFLIHPIATVPFLCHPITVSVFGHDYFLFHASVIISVSEFRFHLFCDGSIDIGMWQLLATLQGLLVAMKSK